MGGRPRRHRQAAVRCPEAERDGAGIARRHRHVVDIAAKLGGDDPGQHRLGALADRRRAADDMDLARRSDAHGDRLEGPTAGALDEVGEADADVAALGSLRPLARREIVPARLLDSALLTFGIIAAVEQYWRAATGLQRLLVGHLLGPDEIAAADLGAVKAHLARHPVEQSFHGEGRLRVAGAAHRRHRHLVGQRQPYVHPERRDLVKQGERFGGILRDVDAARGVGAVIVDDRTADAEDARLGVDGDLDLPVLVAFLGGGDEMLAPVLDPLDRASQQQGGHRHHGVLGIDHELGPEAAADLRRDHPHPALIPAEHLDQGAHGGMGHLGRAPQRQQIVHRVMDGDGAAAFDRMAAAAVLPDRLGEDMGGAGEGGIDIAVAHVELGEQIVRGASVRGGRAVGQGIAAVGDRRQHIVIDADERHGVLGDVSRIGDNDGDRLTDMDGFVAAERRAAPVLLVARAGKTDDEPLGLEMGHQIVKGEDGAHPGECCRRRLVDGADGGMAVGTAHEGGVQHARHGDVVDEPRLAAQQRRILQPLGAGGGDLLAHRALPPSMAYPFAPSPSRLAASSTAATTP